MNKINKGEQKKMKNKNIAKISIIANIVLIIVIFNLVIGNGNIIKEKQIIKEMTQSELESSLDSTIKQLNANQELYANNVQAYKKQIAEAVTNQGVATSENDTGAVIATNIGKILSTKTVATATAAQILKGQTAWVNGAQVTGTMVDNGAVNKTLSAGGSYTIPAGYHNGSGKVTVSTLASQTDGTATAAQILSGKTAYVDGALVTGTMANKGAVTSTLNAGGSYTIPTGYHNGSGKVTATALKDQTAGTATAATIASGKTAWVNGAKITGTMSTKTAAETVASYASNIQVINLQETKHDYSFTVVSGAKYLLVTEGRYDRTVNVYSGATVNQDISASISKFRTASKGYIITTTSSTLVLQVPSDDGNAGIGVLVRLS